MGFFVLHISLIFLFLKSVEKRSRIELFFGSLWRKVATNSSLIARALPFFVFHFFPFRILTLWLISCPHTIPFFLTYSSLFSYFSLGNETRAHVRNTIIINFVNAIIAVRAICKTTVFGKHSAQSAASFTHDFTRFRTKNYQSSFCQNNRVF